MKRLLNSSRSGFTMLEIIVVLSLMGVVGTIGITGFFRITEYWGVLQENLRLNKSAANAFDAFSKDIDNMLSSEVAGVALQGIHANTEDNIHFWRITFEDDSITFPAQIINPLTLELERLLITYAINRGDQEPRLVRSTSLLENPDDITGATLIAEDVTGMRIQYFDGNTWQEEWNQPTSPRLVRISLSLIDGNRTDGQLARVATFAIQVQ